MKDKTFTIKPVAGLLDMTSSPDEVPFGGYRYVENCETNPQDRKLHRMTGYERLLHAVAYENADLHYRYGLDRLHLTFMFEAKTPAGFTKLFAASQKHLFAKSNADQSWKTIWEGFGGDASLNSCGEIIMQGANVNSTVLFSNDYDAPVYHVIDQPTNGDGSSVQPVPDFEELNITRVGFLYAWNNLVLAANVVIDGVRQSNLVLWSDYKKPLSFVPNATSSLAGRKFLAYGEIVLNAAELADALLLYTNRGIWEVRTTTATDAANNPVVLSFTKRYTDKDGSGCLKFKRTLINTGKDHFYAGEDGIYKYNFYLPQPEIEEWSRRAASHLFLNGIINKERCLTHCSGYDTSKKAMWFSYARDGDECNSETLVMNTETHFSSFVREGFTCFLNYNPRTVKSLREWVLENCICTLEEVASPVTCIAPATSDCPVPVYGENLATGTYDLESGWTVGGLEAGRTYLLTLGPSEVDNTYWEMDNGGQRFKATNGSAFTFVAASDTVTGLAINLGFQPFTFTIQLIESTEGMLFGYTSNSGYTLHDVLTEDWRAEPSAGSLRVKLAGVTQESLCGQSEQCSAGTLFIFSSVLDRCIKQASSALFRQRCIGFDLCGTYENRGYLSILRSGPINLQVSNADKIWTRFCAEIESVPAVIPGRIALRIGVAATALDSNQTACPIIWEAMIDPDTGQAYQLKCLTDRTLGQHVAGNTRPDDLFEWPLHYQGKWHYFELVIFNSDSTPIDVGAAVAISRLEFDAREVK